MKLLTLNVHGWLEKDSKQKIRYLAQVIAENEYDVVALQEVNQKIESNFVTHQLKKDNYGLLLLKQLNQLVNKKYSYFWSNSHIGYDIFDEGIAILTHLPVYDIDSFYCSKSKHINSISSRKIIGVTVSYNNQKVVIYSCHINLPDGKENQLDNIKSILSRDNSDNLKILMGDFNLDALSNEIGYQNILKLGLYDCFYNAIEKDDGITVQTNIDGWKEVQQEKRLDYIFLTKEKEVLSSKVIFNGKNKNIISDHYGVESKINL